METTDIVKQLKKSNPEIGKAIKSYNSIISAISNKYPELNEGDAEKIALILLDEIGKNIKKGNDIAFVKSKSDRKGEISIIQIKKL